MNSFIAYGKQWLDDDDIAEVVQTLKSDFLTQGPKIEEFEQAICKYTGAKHCVAVSNGTAALHLAVLALNLGNGEGITTPNTFVASANCLAYCGLTPAFADIREDTCNIDLVEIKKRVTDKTKVIVAVDFAGQVADLEEIYDFAKSKGIYVIEDAAHSIGSSFADGSKVGSNKYSDLTTFSFHPVKTITTGEGGAITTNDEKIYKQLLLLRSHGITKDPAILSQNPGPWYYEMQDLGFNYRITDIQAALGLSQLRKLDKFAARRREIVDKYNKAFAKLPNVVTPYEKPGVGSAFHLYVLKIDFAKIGKTRKEVMEELRKNNVGSQVHYIPAHLQPYYQDTYGYKVGDYPVAEAYYEQCLSLPLYPKMTDVEVNFVIQKIKILVS
ncbi:MAG: UDP-4-amino-4,6-dideoxy-N-acetyl-beta-L-altrosamine transaminase [Patescibacteria group bacterium]|jgi:UDP-4-amino-4,6-dideoxy-N-acetyl-beta-L-altrosamine transaminase